MRRLLIGSLAVVALVAGMTWLLTRVSRSSAGAPGWLVAEQVVLPGSAYVEGMFSYVHLETAPGRSVLTREVRDPERRQPLITRPLAPGEYRLVSYQRPCVASCPHPDGTGPALGPPVDVCEATFEIESGEALRVEVRLQPGQGCSVAFPSWF